jgi:hypothetical protein
VDAIAYLEVTGYSWRQLPRDLPQTVSRYFARQEEQEVTG